jgi:hypothetical protein
MIVTAFRVIHRDIYSTTVEKLVSVVNVGDPMAQGP